MQMTCGKGPCRLPMACSCEPDLFDGLRSNDDDEDATESDSVSNDSNDATDAAYDADASNDSSDEGSFVDDAAYNADASNNDSSDVGSAVDDSQATEILGDSEDSVQFLCEVRPGGLTLVFAESVTLEPEGDFRSRSPF